MWAVAQPLKEQMRALETLGKPVVAAINGAALGGGWELCLCAQHRIALDNPKITLGLPEVTLGLLPGGGGVVRMVRLLGIEACPALPARGPAVQPGEGQGTRAGARARRDAAGDARQGARLDQGEPRGTAAV